MSTARRVVRYSEQRRVGTVAWMQRMMTRRQLMTAGALTTAAMLAACTNSTDSTSKRQVPTTSVPQHGDVGRLVAAIADEEGLLGYCTALISRHQQLATVAAPIRQRQRQHVDALRSALRHLDPPTAHRRVVAPARATVAEAKLTELAAATQRRRFEDCLAAESGLLARLFASTSASHAVTAHLLRAQR